jgi:MoxR-like ATPase
METDKEKSKEVCEVCGKTSKWMRGKSQGHLWCYNCYKKQLKHVRAKKVLPAREDVVDSEKFEKEFAEYISSLSDEMKQHIPDENGYVDETGILGELEQAYKYNFLAKDTTEKFNFCFIGETGTGKTQCAVSFAHKINVPCYHVTFNGAITPEQLIGFQKLIINKDGIQEQVWQDGILTKFVRNGGVIILDEVNACPNEIAFVLFPLLDKLRKLDLLECNGEVVKAHKGFFVIGTMNPDYAGTNDLNVALASRFNQPRYFDYSVKVEKALVKQGRILNDAMVELARKQRIRWEQGEFTKPISTRDLVVFKTSYDVFGEEKALLNLCNHFKTNEEKKAIAELYELEVRSKTKIEDALKKVRSEGKK